MHDKTDTWLHIISMCDQFEYSIARSGTVFIDGAISVKISRTVLLAASIADDHELGIRLACCLV